MQNGLAFIPVNKIPSSNNIEIKAEPIEIGLSSHISKCWELNRNAKQQHIEHELLNDLRAKKGEYSASELREIREQGGSEIYMMLTNSKMRGLKAWIRDIIMPAGDKAWEIEPTPLPDLPVWAERSIAERIQQTVIPGEQQKDLMDRVGKLRDLVISGLRQDAKKRGERMSMKIDDQLTEGGWEVALDQFIDDFSTFSAGIIKGPIKHKRKKLSWGHDENGVIPVAEDIIQHEVSRVSPFDCYPSPNAETPNDGDFIEHIRLTRRELRSFLDVEGYSNKAISDVLEEYGRGGLREWMWENSERKDLEGKSNWWMNSGYGTLDGLHYWGSVQGKLLIEWGYKKEKDIDPYGEYEIDAIKIGNHTIRAVINKDPLSRRPYHKACFDPVPGSFWGNSLRYLMRDIQSMCNATARSISNNVGMASGPMVEIHEDKLLPGQTVDIFPWKIYQTERGETTGNSPNIHFFQPKLNAHELLRVYEEFERRADDATGVPRYATGNERVGGAGATSSGLAMLMSSASRGIKAAISQIDLYVTRSIVEQFYFYNMIEDPDPMIKGDVAVVARGATALLVKEQAHNDRMEFMQMTNNETDMNIIGLEGRAKMLREHSKVLDMPNLIPDDDEIKARLNEQQKSQQQQPQDPAILKIGIEEKKIQAAKELNSEKVKVSREDIQAKRFIEEERAKSDSDLQRMKLASEERIANQKLRAETRTKLYIEKMRLADMEKSKTMEQDKSRESRDKDVSNILKMLTDMQKMKQDHKPERSDRHGDKEIHVHIDNKSGNVTKRISVDKRDKDGKVKEITSEAIDSE